VRPPTACAAPAGAFQASLAAFFPVLPSVKDAMGFATLRAASFNWGRVLFTSWPLLWPPDPSREGGAPGGGGRCCHARRRASALRLLVPRPHRIFPPISQPEGRPLTIQDAIGKEWHFQFRFWPNNISRMYVLEGVIPCILSLQLQAGDTGN